MPRSGPGSSGSGVPVEIDFAPFLEVARLLYEGPWVAERYAAIAWFIENNPQALYPVTRQIIEKGRTLSAVDNLPRPISVEVIASRQ